jgi:4'-phosphopantetheinyl transferase
MKQDCGPRLPLADGAVTVWWMLVASPPDKEIARWFASLSHEEQTQANQLQFAVDREAYIAAHALTRTLLEAVGGLPAPAWDFVANSTGKPEINRAHGQSRLRFNLSHTRGLVVCAATLDNDIGIDVEVSNSIKDELEIAERFFAPDEVSLLRSVAKNQRSKAFARIWTLKEAYIKPQAWDSHVHWTVSHSGSIQSVSGSEVTSRTTQQAGNLGSGNQPTGT